jgi:hypothetical protein
VGIPFSGYLIASTCFFEIRFFNTNTGPTNFVNIFSRRRALACAALQTHVQVGADKQISPLWSRVTRAQILILNVRFAPQSGHST